MASSRLRTAITTRVTPRNSLVTGLPRGNARCSRGVRSSIRNGKNAPRVSPPTSDVSHSNRTPSGRVRPLATGADTATPAAFSRLTSAARFFAPEAVATAADGRIYVADTGNDTIRRIALDGTVTTIAGTARIQGATDDVGAAARFDQPDGITLDPTGTALYVSDALTSTIRRITNVT